MIEFSFGEVEAVLVALNHVADEKRTAFRARLKHFQRLGFPAGANTGTGTRAIYTFPMLLQMCLATELAQTGMAPLRIVEMIKWNWSDQMGGLFLAMLPGDVLDQFTPPFPDNNLVWTLAPEALRDLTKEGAKESDALFAVRVFPAIELVTQLYDVNHNPTGGDYRHVVIFLKPLMWRITSIVRSIRSDITFADLGQEFEQYLRDFQEKVTETAKMIGKKKAPDASNPQA